IFDCRVYRHIATLNKRVATFICFWRIWLRKGRVNPFASNHLASENRAVGLHYTGVVESLVPTILCEALKVPFRNPPKGEWFMLLMF
ncbi:MAG: hypothetical protein QMC37_08220, partial [Flavobacteriales bacterium]